MSNPSVLLESNYSAAVNQQIIRSSNIAGRIQDFQKLYKNDALTTDNIYALAKLLIQKHTPKNFDPLQEFQIPIHDLLKGVHCPSCSFLSMKRMHGTWKCATCGHQSKDAHLRALADFHLLIGETISIKQMCCFLKLPSRYVANRLLKSLNLKYEGETRFRKYILPNSLID